MAENLYIQLAQNNMSDYTSSVSSDHYNTSNDWHDTIGEGLKVTATGIGVVFAVLLIMIIFINVIKKSEYVLEGLLNSMGKKSGSQADTADSQKDQNIDNTTLVLISAAVAAYTHKKARIRRISVLPSRAKQGGNWAMQARSALQSSHSKKY